MQPLIPANWPKLIRAGARIFIGSGASVPLPLIQSMLQHHKQLRDLELIHIHTLGETPWIQPQYEQSLRTNTFFLTPEVAQAVREGRADYTPCSLSEVPQLFQSTILPIDVALISVAAADSHGRHSLGVSVDVTHAAIQSAQLVIALVNPNMPLSQGSPSLHPDQIDYFLEASHPLPEWQLKPDTSPKRQRIANYLAELVDDGATLQVGLGATPQQAILGLQQHRHLGIHTGMFSDNLRHLIETGVIDNSRKGFHNGRTIASHCLGSQKLYRYIHQNDNIHLRPSDWVNNPQNIARNHCMTAINGARQIDLTGQIVRDSSGNRFYGGVGAQLDFLRGASASSGGRPICVMPSIEANGSSRIVANFESGTQVATARSDTHYVITEYGIANLHGRNIRERALALIQIAHPDHREELLRGAHQRGWLPTYITIPPTSLPSEQTPSGVEIQRLQLHNLDHKKAYLQRPLHPIDIRRLQRFFYDMSARTVRLRFGYQRQHMAADSAYQLVSVDQSQDLALGIFEETGQGHEEVIRAIARFYRDSPNSPGAEIAFVVHQSLRRCGIATTLLVQLADIAKARDIQHFHAEVLRENKGMQALFQRFQATKTRSPDVEGYQYTLTIDQILQQRHLAKLRDPQPAQQTTAPTDNSPHNPPSSNNTQARDTNQPSQSYQKTTTAMPSHPLLIHHSPEYLKHDTGHGHVETPQRYQTS